MFSLSDWVLIGTSLFLGAVALFVPYFAELLKRRFFAPRLKLIFEEKPPFCPQTFWGSPSDPLLHEPVFFFRFQVTNEGMSQAKLIEAILEELWVFDAAGKPQKVTSFSPVNLRYDQKGSQYIPLNPKRKIFWAIGHISSRKYQTSHEQQYRIDIPGRDKKALAFILELLEYPLGQPNALSVYSENARTESISLILDWSGKWQATESEMFREIVLTQVPQIS
jgi:hypothetical protein